MEVLTLNVANIGCKLAGENSNLCRSKITCSAKSQLFCVHRSQSFRFSGTNRSILENRDHRECSRLNSKVLSSNSDSYVIDGDDGVDCISGSGEATTKVLIPGLPDDSSALLHSCYWEWRPKLNVHYQKAGCENLTSPAVLFLPGFGVGSFHYENQLKDLGRDYRVWAIDFLGQGMSLPAENPTSVFMDEDDTQGNNSIWGFGDQTQPWADNLVYSIDLWRDQVRYFVEEVIGEPVYIVGNSLGGFVALYLAASSPQLVKGVTLLNATPFWGFLPNPTRSPRLAQFFPWSGTFPLPPSVRKITEILWEKISDPNSIAKILRQVYADHSTDVDRVFSRILEITQHPAAAASFASIMCAPQSQLSFKECLTSCKTNDVPICLVYGKEDPWVTPVWGIKVKHQMPEAPYYEISLAGHCPHDEVPEVVNFLLRGWIRNVESRGCAELALLDGMESVEYGVSRELEFTRRGSKKLVSVRLFGSKFSMWGQIRSYVSGLKLKLPNLGDTL